MEPEPEAPGGRRVRGGGAASRPGITHTAAVWTREAEGNRKGVCLSRGLGEEQEPRP